MGVMQNLSAMSLHGGGMDVGATGLRILLVEDDRMARLVLSDQLVQLGHRVETAENGAQAYTMLREEARRADMVITDRFMPVLDGLGLTRRLRRERATEHLPIVMLTGAGDAASVAEGLEAGVMQYLTKPVAPNLLFQVLEMARRQIEGRQKLSSTISAHQAGFANIQRVDFHLRHMGEVGPVASLLASLAPNSEKLLPGLRELLANAIEHGLYRLGGAAKQQLMLSGQLDDELARRAKDPAYPGHVEAAAQRIDGGLRYAVRDPGAGFVWRNFLRPDPSRGLGESGRGLMRANLIFNEIHFHGNGNLVTAVAKTEASRIW